MKKTDIAASQPSYEEILRKERRANSAWNKLRRNKTAMIGLFIIVIMTAIAVFAPFITGGKPNEIHPIDAYLGFFEKGHLFGTDEAGRDLFTRICYGARVSLLVAVGATVLGGVIGVALGLISGYARRGGCGHYALHGRRYGISVHPAVNYPNDGAGGWYI